VLSDRSPLWISALALPLLCGPLWCRAFSQSAGFIGTLAGFVLVAALAISAITDICRHRIYNWVTYSAFLWAVLINLTATLLATGETTLVRAYQQATTFSPDLLGGIGLTACLAGAAICFVVTLFGYRMSGGGAGDVKLAAVIGALLGPHYGVYAVAYSYIIAAIAILCWSARVNGPLVLLRAGLRGVGNLLGPLWPFPPTATDTALLMQPIPLGPYFAIGTLLVVLELVPA
jgi:prepilin peptidase CpaA